MVNDSLDDGPSDRGRTWWRVGGLFLMLPIGIILVIVLIIFFGRGYYYPGGLLIFLLIVFIVLFIIRVLFMRSRRRYWGQRHEHNGPIRIVRERYARGEITKEQYDQIMQDLRQRQRP